MFHSYVNYQSVFFFLKNQRVDEACKTDVHIFAKAK